MAILKIETTKMCTKKSKIMKYDDDDIGKDYIDNN